MMRFSLLKWYAFLKCLFIFYRVSIFEFLLLWLGLVLKTSIILHFVCIECTYIFNKILLFSFSV